MNEDKHAKFKKRKNRNEYLENVMTNKINAWDDFFANEPEVQYIMRKYSPSFLSEYDKGFECYLNGEWKQAKLHLDRALVLS